MGDYTIVHVGFALSKIDEETALINHQRSLAGDTDFLDFSQDRGGDGGVLAYLMEARAGQGR